MKEDRLVRRGIDVLKQRHGSGDEDGSEDDGGALRPKGRGKETIVDVDMDDMDGGGSVAKGEGQGKNRMRKSKAAKKVCFDPLSQYVWEGWAYLVG